MKIIIATFLLMVLPFFGFTQIKYVKNLGYEIGKPYKSENAYYRRYFQKDGELLAIKVFKKSETVIQKLDAKNLNLISSNNISDLPKGATFEDVIEFNDRYFFIFTVKSNSDHEVFYREIDFQTGTFLTKDILLFHIKGKQREVSKSIIGTMFSAHFGDKLDYVISPDGKNLLFLYSITPKGKDTKIFSSVGLFVFDESLNIIWGKEVKMPYTLRKLDFYDTFISNDTKAYILSKVYNDDSGKDKKNDEDIVPNYKMELFVIDGLSEAFHKIPTSLNRQFIHNLIFLDSFPNELVCAGFYSKGEELKNSEGIFVWYLNEKGEILTAINEEIPEDVMEQYAKKQDEKEKWNAKIKGLRDLNVLFVEPNKDGSMVFFCEEQYSIWRPGTKRSYYTYHYDDILVIRFSKNGKIDWIKKLPKKQTGFNGKRSMSFHYIKHNQTHYLLFLDNIKNLDLPVDVVPTRYSDRFDSGVLTAYQIDDTSGETIKLSYFDLHDVKNVVKVSGFNTHRITHSQDGECLIEVNKSKKEEVLIKIKLDQ